MIHSKGIGLDSGVQMVCKSISFKTEIQNLFLNFDTVRNEVARIILVLKMEFKFFSNESIPKSLKISTPASVGVFRGYPKDTLLEALISANGHLVNLNQVF